MARRAQQGQRQKQQQMKKQGRKEPGRRRGAASPVPLRPIVQRYRSVPLDTLLTQARAALEERLGAAAEEAAPRPLHIFFSFTDATQRARVVKFTGRDLKAVWRRLEAWQRRVGRRLPGVRWLRVDWVTSAFPITWGACQTKLQRTKRNYFRYGIALDSELEQAFLEQELNANAMLYPGGSSPNAGLNSNNFVRYGQRRFGKAFRLPDDDQHRVLLLATRGLLFQAGAPALPLHGLGDGRPGGGDERHVGRRVVARLDAAQVTALIEDASRFLAEQVGDEGRFVYGLHPCFDREINTYNTLRHASTTYAMLEAWEVTRDAFLKAAIDRSLGYLTQRLIRTCTLASGESVAYLVDHNDEIKLGGNAVCLLALVKYTELTDDRQYMPLLERLAQGIQHMQNPSTGQFVHVLNAEDLSVKEVFRIIYYDGEAAFGLMRLYGLTRDPRWLETVEKAFDYFIGQRHWKAHDHWLSYCVNELTRYRPEERYYRFGIHNVAGHLDFVSKRITTFPTLLELMMAAHDMIQRLQSSDTHRHLLEPLNLDTFYRALETRAHRLLDGFFWPELAMYYRNPQRILGSFFIRHHAFRVRIDDVEHYLSGYVAYLQRYLPQKA